MEKKKTAIKTKQPKKTTNKAVTSVTDSNDKLKAQITNLESAYLAALSGKIKFGEVKDIFKKMHKEIKQSNKK
jgi:hypothetical protein